ncbi:hypothetical protein, partial [Burkholderia ubonensis]|uniref:hypothetical protein n=1 Tax=Burkholderia ubonensis TaxID=101571 RepID=UPI001C4351B4
MLIGLAFMLIVSTWQPWLRIPGHVGPDGRDAGRARLGKRACHAIVARWPVENGHGRFGSPGTWDLSVILWARHIMRVKSHGYADEEEETNGGLAGSGP